ARAPEGARAVSRRGKPRASEARPYACEVAGEVADHFAFHDQAPGRVELELAPQGADELAVQVASIEVSALDPGFGAGRGGATQPDGDPAGIGVVVLGDALAIGEADLRLRSQAHHGDVGGEVDVVASAHAEAEAQLGLVHVDVQAVAGIGVVLRH